MGWGWGAGGGGGVERAVYFKHVLPLFAPHLFIFRCLGKTVRECGLCWVYLE